MDDGCKGGECVEAKVGSPNRMGGHLLVEGKAEIGYVLRRGRPHKAFARVELALRTATSLNSNYASSP